MARSSLVWTWSMPERLCWRSQKNADGMKFVSFIQVEKLATGRATMLLPWNVHCALPAFEKLIFVFPIVQERVKNTRATVPAPQQWAMRTLNVLRATALRGSSRTPAANIMRRVKYILALIGQCPQFVRVGRFHHPTKPESYSQRQYRDTHRFVMGKFS
jgi:hypothetical protein